MENHFTSYVLMEVFYMQITSLVVTNVHITEDEYNYKASFNISNGGRELRLELSDLDNPEKLKEIKTDFGLSEALEEIRKFIFDAVIEKSALSSRNTQGESYEAETNKKAGKSAGTLDMA
jgi:hypothetical protein